MQKRILTAFSMLSLSLVLAKAQSTVIFSAALGQPNVYWSGAAVPDNNEVRIGFFNTGFDISSHVNDLNALDAAWKLYGNTTTTDILGMQPGSFTGSASQPGGSGGASLFEGQKIYLWIFKTGNNGAPAADYSNVSGYGLYSSTGWVFPNSSDMTTGSGSITTLDVNQSWYGTYDASHLYLSAVPEPSLATLLVIGMGLMLGVVRRKR
jgi:hypothetical protein